MRDITYECIRITYSSSAFPLFDRIYSPLFLIKAAFDAFLLRQIYSSSNTCALTGKCSKDADVSFQLLMIKEFYSI